MFLKSLSLHNFRCLANVQVPFDKAGPGNRKWTLILGENGAGKSNVLKSIALVTAGSSALGELIGNPDQWIRFGQKACTISVVLETKKGEEREVSLKIKKGQHLSDIFRENAETLRMIDDAIANASRNYFVVGYGASRSLVTEGFGAKSNRSANVGNLFNNSFPLNPLANWIMELDYKEGKAGLEIVKSALDEFLPGAAFHSIDKRKKQVVFETPDGLIPLEHLSDGYQNMASWIGDILFRVTDSFRDYNKPLEARGLLLIDEIDLHLHPKWQRRLLDFIDKKLPNFQVVATTHSPLTAQQAGEGELFALKRNAKQGIQVVPFVGSPKKLLVNQLLMTPVFGLETDESLVVQQKKEEYRQLKDKGAAIKPNEKRKMAQIKSELSEIVPSRDVAVLSEREVELLDRLSKTLQIN